MDKTQQAAQLRLAADILETGHPWHLYRAGKLYDADPKAPPQYYASCPAAPEGPFEIRPVLATPPDGRTLHNPGKLTAEQVGVGYRLFCKGENNGQHANQAEMWIGKWVQANDAEGQITTYRAPLSVPWPEAEKPDPYAELKKAHAEGIALQYANANSGGAWSQWRDYDGSFSIDDHGGGYRQWRKKPDPYRTSRPLTFEHAGKTWTWHRPGDPRPCDGEMRVACVFVDHDVWDDKLLCAHEVNWGDDAGQGCIIGWRYADEKKTVPLGPEDVKPFTVIRRKGEAQTWHWRTVSYVDAVKVTCGNRVYGWDELASSYERNESLPLTGKWNPSAWEPCSKPA